MAVTFNKKSSVRVPFETKVMPKVEDIPGAKPIDLKKAKTTASGVVKKEPITTRERKASKQEIEVVIDRAIKNGTLVPRSGDSPADTTDPKLREDFGRLIYIGATRDTICEILKIPIETYRRLKREWLEATVDSLAETGVIGMVAMSFDKLEFASQRLLQTIASIGDKPEERSDLITAINALRNNEVDKVTLLVKTGAIKIKKKTDVSIQMESLTGGTQPLLTGDKANSIMVRVLGKIVEASEADDDGEDEENQ